MSLKMQRTVSGEADVFNFAKVGDINKLKILFESGLASPHDLHFESGVTPLHVRESPETRAPHSDTRQYAVNHRHLNVCKFLLQMNADPFLEDRTRWYVRLGLSILLNLTVCGQECCR